MELKGHHFTDNLTKKTLHMPKLKLKLSFLFKTPSKHSILV